jgi:hypothetical protein
VRNVIIIGLMLAGAALTACGGRAPDASISENGHTPPTEDKKPKAWPKEPDDFKGLKFGMTRAEVHKVPGLSHCADEGLEGFCMKQAPRMDKYDGFMVGGTTAKDGITMIGGDQFSATFNDSGKLDEISARFLRQPDFEAVKAIFIDKYGPPTSSTTDILQNGFGAMFSQENLAWVGDNIRIDMQRYKRYSDGTYSTDFSSVRIRPVKQDTPASLRIKNPLD